MADLVGYKLIVEDTGEVLQSWGGVWGQCPGIPTFVRLPNGDDVHCPPYDTPFGVREELDDKNTPTGKTTGTLVRITPWMMDPPVLPPAKISKRVVVERLQKAGKFEAAFAALGGPGQFMYERWSASVEVDPENPDVIGLLTAIGADITEILRPGDEV